MSINETVLQDVVIKFAGDSGDGMQLTGTQFTNNTALMGIDLATFPDFPAEIRAPIGTVAGVSGYQLHFSSNKVYTPGDIADVLVAMNAAALKKMGVPVVYEVGDNFDEIIENWLNAPTQYPTMKANNIPETLQYLFDTYDTK